MNPLILVVGLVLILGLIVLAANLAGARRRLDVLEVQQAGLERRVSELEVEHSKESASPANVPVSEQAVQSVGLKRGDPETGPVRGAPLPPPVLARPWDGAVAAPRTATARTGVELQKGGAATATGGEPPRVRPGPAPLRGVGMEKGMDWESFMGAKLFAWLGGLALFLGMAYFVKYSFDRNLIPPSARVAIGLMAGLGLLIGGSRLRRAAYSVTSQTLCGTGVVILYASLFAGHAFYALPWLPTAITYGLMTVVTGVAFTLSVRMEARAVAVLGMLGGFLTPILLSKGQDQAVALFCYVALLDIGLVAVALRRRWEFLAVGAAVGTLVMELGWLARFFTPDKVWGAWLILASFGALFAVALAVAAWRRAASDAWCVAVAVSSLVTLGFAGWLLGPGGFGDRPGVVFTFVLSADLCLLAMAWVWDRAAWVQVGAGFVGFGYLVVWMAVSMTGDLLYWGLGLTLVFAGLHGVFPVVLRWMRPGFGVGSGGVPLAGVFPAMAVAALVVPLIRLESPSLAIWPTLALLNLVAMGLAAWGGGYLGALAAMLLSGVAMSLWIGGLPAGAVEFGGPMLVVMGVSIVLAGAGAGLLARVRGGSLASGREGAGGDDPRKGWSSEEAGAVPLPVVATLMPFLLLAQLLMHLRIPNPSGVFGAMAVLIVMLLGLAGWLRLGALPLVGMAGAALVEHAWWAREGSGMSHPVVAVVWFVVIYGVFAMYPLAMRERMKGLRLPWVAAALGAIPAFHLVYRVVDWTWPNPVMGLVPVAFAIPVAMTFAWEARRGAGDGVERLDWLDRLAWFGGVGLFLLTVALPIQFDHQWLTLGLALEGAALLWLATRVPHEGLRLVGVGLLGTTFVRLVLNPWVMDYAVRGPWPLWNWWLYSFGIGAASMFAGAWWLRAAGDRIPIRNARALLVTLGTILVFALVNTQVADFFTSEGDRVRFEFSGHFGRDMTYTIAWALFALALVVIGLNRAVTSCRWAGLGLLAVATVKLFLHDLARLDHLYRVGALMGVALVAIAASVLYQRFVARGAGGRQI